MFKDFLLHVGLPVGILVSFGIGDMVGYRNGVHNTHKQAFEHGLMIKEIDHGNDEVIYRWIETHKEVDPELPEFKD